MILRRLFSKPTSHIHRVGQTMAITGFVILVVGIGCGVFASAIEGTVLSRFAAILTPAAIGVGSSLLALGIGMLADPRDPSRQPRVFSTRNEAMDAMKSIIDGAGKREANALRILAIAGTDFFRTNSDLAESFLSAVRSKKKVRFLFLDPESDAAERREKYESKRPNKPVKTRAEIVHCLGIASEYESENPDSTKLLVYPDPSCFLIFNGDQMVMHTYLCSTTGHAMTTYLLLSGGDEFARAKEHFDNVWKDGKRWDAASASEPPPEH